MTDSVFKAPKAKRSMKGNTQSQQWSTSPRKRRRTKDDFVTFCSFVLEYTNYESMKQEESRHRNNGSPLDSSGSTADSFTSESLSESTSSVFSSPEPDTDGETQHHPPHSRFDGETQHHPPHSRFDGETQHRPPHSRFAPGPDDSDEELITCFCMKPYGGRPMIECSECFTWIHFSCAKIRKTNVPEVFVCQNCRNTKSSTRKSGRQRSDKKVLDA